VHVTPCDLPLLLEAVERIEVNRQSDAYLFKSFFSNRRQLLHSSTPSSLPGELGNVLRSHTLKRAEYRRQCDITPFRSCSRLSVPHVGEVIDFDAMTFATFYRFAVLTDAFGAYLSAVIDDSTCPFKCFRAVQLAFVFGGRCLLLSRS
jgi:hypothetical protein